MKIKYQKLQISLESEIRWYNNQNISLVSHFAKVEQIQEVPILKTRFIHILTKFSYLNMVFLDLSHKYIGDHIDWTGSKNEFVKSVDLIDMSIRKNWYNNIISLNFTNLLNERYEKPGTYSQDGRMVSFGFRRSY